MAILTSQSYRAQGDARNHLGRTEDDEGILCLGATEGKDKGRLEHGLRQVFCQSYRQLEWRSLANEELLLLLLTSRPNRQVDLR